MPFYVSVGPRGLLFRFGMVLTDVMGSLAYWRAGLHRAPHDLRHGLGPSRSPGPFRSGVPEQESRTGFDRNMTKNP
jgi:hypothetical protein